MKLKTALIFLFFTTAGFGQEFMMGSVDFTEPLYGNSVFEFPKLESVSSENSEIVDKVNAEILSGLNLISYDEENIYSQEDRDEMNMFKWSDLTSNSEIKDDVLYLNFSFFYNHSYPMYVEESLYFDLKTGERLKYWDIPFHTLFSLSGYLDFLNEYWIDSVKKEFELAIACAEYEPYCSYYDIDNYWVDSNELSLSLTNKCYDYHSQFCTPSYRISIDLDSVKNNLSDIGKYILLESDYFSKTAIEQFLENDSLSRHFQNNKFIFAKIDGKYPISMAIHTNKEGQVSGYYYYDKNRLNLSLTGQLKNDTLSMEETYKDEVTGFFEFEIDPKYGYIANATWFNPKKTKQYAIEFNVIKEAYKR